MSRNITNGSDRFLLLGFDSLGSHSFSDMYTKVGDVYRTKEEEIKQIILFATLENNNFLVSCIHI